MTFYCTACWNEIEGAATVCPRCGADQELLSREGYVEKLLRALRAREPETPVRAATVLGALRAVEALPVLWDIAETSNDPYIAAACVKAIGDIADSSALPRLEALVRSDRSFITRRAAQSAIAKLTRLQGERP